MPRRPDDELFRIWASAVIVDEWRRVLISHRRDYDLWNLAGGKLDAGELPEEALRREVAEETGLEVVETELVGVYAKADRSPTLTFSYRCRVSPGSAPRPSEEADLHLWLPPEDWPANAHPGHLDRVGEALDSPSRPVQRVQDQPWGRAFLADLQADRLPAGEFEPFQRDRPTPEVVRRAEELARTRPGSGVLADLLRILGRLDEAREILEERLSREVLDPRQEIADRIRLATVHLYQGDHRRAEGGLWRALELITRTEGQPYKDFAYQHLGKTMAEQHRWKEAAEYLKRAAKLREGGPEGLRASTARALSEVASRMGQRSGRNREARRGVVQRKRRHRGSLMDRITRMPDWLIGLVIALVLGAGALVAGALLGAGDDPRITSTSTDAEASSEIVEGSFTMFDGSTATFADFRGRPLVLNFWASWCPPCAAEMPDLQQAYETFQGEVGFLGVNTQEVSRENADELVAQTGVRYPLAVDPDGALYRQFGGIAMPTTVFIDGEGRVIEVHNGALFGDDLHARIIELFELQ